MTNIPISKARPEAHAEIIRLYQAGGLSLSEIGRRCGVSTPTVSNVVRRHGYKPKATAATNRPKSVQRTTEPETVPQWRCPTCRGLIYTPTCRLCETLKAMRAER